MQPAINKLICSCTLELLVRVCLAFALLFCQHRFPSAEGCVDAMHWLSKEWELDGISWIFWPNSIIHCVLVLLFSLAGGCCNLILSLSEVLNLTGIDWLLWSSSPRHWLSVLLFPPAGVCCSLIHWLSDLQVKICWLSQPCKLLN